MHIHLLPFFPPSSIPTTHPSLPRWSGQKGYLQANRTRWYLPEEDNEGREGAEKAPLQVGWVQRYDLLTEAVVAGAGMFTAGRSVGGWNGVGRTGSHLTLLITHLPSSLPNSLP